ncbi:patatin-like phospholipase family protein [Nocardioides marinisabuli]|uniref:patatin-like phospholipase family protein n=1 Tax=Nocardioides marinisabuli TaxID=419476 RepID=UPI003D2F6D7A
MLRGLTGRSRSLFPGEPLGELVAERAGIDDLEQADIPVHLLATDLFTGADVLLSTGSVRDGARATAAVPGVLPPVQVGARWLVDGAIATRAGVSHAIELGAARVVVLPAGVPCAIQEPPRSVIGVAVHARPRRVPPATDQSRGPRRRSRRPMRRAFAAGGCLQDVEWCRGPLLLGCPSHCCACRAGRKHTLGACGCRLQSFPPNERRGFLARTGAHRGLWMGEEPRPSRQQS